MNSIDLWEQTFALVRYHEVVVAHLNYLIILKSDEMNKVGIDPDDYTDEYDQWLRDVYEDVNVCGQNYDAVTVLKQIDQPAYTQGLLDYVDGKDVEDTPEWKKLDAELDALNDTLNDAADWVERVKDILDSVTEQGDMSPDDFTVYITDVTVDLNDLITNRVPVIPEEYLEGLYDNYVTESN